MASAASVSVTVPLVSVSRAMVVVVPPTFTSIEVAPKSVSAAAVLPGGGGRRGGGAAGAVPPAVAALEVAPKSVSAAAVFPGGAVRTSLRTECVVTRRSTVKVSEPADAAGPAGAVTGAGGVGAVAGGRRGAG